MIMKLIMAVLKDPRPQRSPPPTIPAPNDPCRPWLRTPASRCGSARRPRFAGSDRVTGQATPPQTF